jgi:putative ABC transport system permease protein
MSTMAQDLRYAARTLRQSPGFTIAAAMTLALGVGANTAIFAVVNAVMLRPLPYDHADRLVRIWESNTAVNRPTSSVSHPNFLDWRVEATAFDALAATVNNSFTSTSAQGAEVIRGSGVTADFFRMLQVQPALGRTFSADEDRVGGDVRVAVVSDGFWRRRFAADPSIVGRQIPLDGASYMVVGVLPSSFTWDAVDVFVPLAPNPARSRGDRQLSVFGRLADGMSMERAQGELANIAAALANTYPAANEGWSARVALLYDALIPASVRESLVFLLGAVALVLLIACANVANLLLARASARHRDMSIRVALGASRGRIVRQLFAESVLLALLAGAIGAALGAATTRLLVAYGPAGVPRLGEASFDVRVMLFALAISMTTAIVFGLVPALHVSRHTLAETLRDATRGSSGGPGRQRWRAALTIAEVALSVALLIGAGLLLRSVWRLQDVNPGFDTRPLMMARVALPEAAYPTRDARAALFERLLAEIQTVPGVVSAATSSAVPLSGRNTMTEVYVPGAESSGRAQASADWRLVSPGYFATMGIALRGRDFSTQDRDTAGSLIIISETMARELWPNLDPIGRTVRLATLGNRVRTIIGVAGDIRSARLDAEPRAMVYYSTVEFNGLNPTSLVWRSAVDPASQVAAVRDVVSRIDPRMPFFEVRALDDLVTDSFASRRFNMYLLGAFASVALLLSAIGLFGVMAYLVSQRTREIGVRLALGADRRAIFQLVLGRGLGLALVGAMLGVGGALWLTQAMQGLLFSVSATDPGTFIAVPMLLLLTAAVACYVPARRAMRVDPVVALRAD